MQKQIHVMVRRKKIFDFVISKYLLSDDKDVISCTSTRFSLFVIWCKNAVCRMPATVKIFNSQVWTKFTRHSAAKNMTEWCTRSRVILHIKAWPNNEQDRLVIKYAETWANTDKTSGDSAPKCSKAKPKLYYEIVMQPGLEWTIIRHDTATWARMNYNLTWHCNLG